MDYYAGGLREPESILDATKRYREEQDVLADFIAARWTRTVLKRLPVSMIPIASGVRARVSKNLGRRIGSADDSEAPVMIRKRNPNALVRPSTK